MSDPTMNMTNSGNSAMTVTSGGSFNLVNNLLGNVYYWRSTTTGTTAPATTNSASHGTTVITVPVVAAQTVYYYEINDIGTSGSASLVTLTITVDRSN